MSDDKAGGMRIQDPARNAYRVFSEMAEDNAMSTLVGDAGKTGGRACDGTADEPAATEKAKATAEQRESTVSKAGGFCNDPDDPTNPNEARERHLDKLRP